MCYSNESNTASIICMSVISIIVIPFVIPLKVIPLRGIWLRVIPLLVIPLIVILFPISHQSTFCKSIFYWFCLSSIILQNVSLENVIAPNNAPDAIVWEKNEDDALEGSARKTRKILKKTGNFFSIFSSSFLRCPPRLHLHFSLKQLHQGH